MSEALPTVDRCLNCDTPISGKFCPECGQKAENRTVSLRLLITDVIIDLINLDGRLFRSLARLLFRPGFLTREYVAGRRTHYTSPFRLYLAMSVVFFLVLFSNVKLGPVGVRPPVPPPAVDAARQGSSEAGTQLESPPPPVPPPDIPFNLEGRIEVGPFVLDLADLKQTLEQYDARQSDPANASPHAPIQQYLTRQAIRMTRDPHGFVSRLKENVPKMMFFLLPFFALLLKLLYVRSRRYYVEHLIFSLHGHAFVFLVLTVSVLLNRTWITLLVLTISVVYLFLSMRTVYGQPWKKTALKLGMLMVSYAMLLMIYLAGTVLVTALTA